LRATIQYNQYQTNLINGGEGRVIFENPIINLINKHVGIGWAKTHFLSFTEDIHTAYKYGSRNMLLGEEEIEYKYVEHFEDSSDWNFALLILDTSKVEWAKLQDGIYEGFYEPTLKLFAHNNEKYRVLLIDVRTILSEWKNFDQSYSKAFVNASGTRNGYCCQQP